MLQGQKLKNWACNGVQWAPKIKHGQEPRTQTQKQDGVVVGVRAGKLKKQDGAWKAMEAETFHAMTTRVNKDFGHEEN